MTDKLSKSAGSAPKVTAKPVPRGATQVLVDEKTGRVRRIAADAKPRSTERKATSREISLSGV